MTMYVPYKLRKPSGLIKPKGPSFSRAKSISCNFDGTVITFKAPKHRARHSNNERLNSESSYKFSEMIFRSIYSEGFNLSDNWDEFKLFYRAWAFYGPWFTGTLAELDMYFSLIKPTNCDNDNFSLFHPRAFEKYVSDYLTNNYSTRKNDLMDGRHEYIAPVNWQPLSNFPTVAVRLEVRPDAEVARATVRHLVFFPISDKVMAHLHFIPSQLLALSQEELDERVDSSSMLELMNNIINSFEITLSPEAEAQQQAAIAGLDDASLVEAFLPIKWDESTQQNEVQKIEK